MAINVTSQTPRVQYVSGSGQTVFAVPFVFYANADLQVYKNGTLLTIGSDYTASGAGANPNGSVTLTSGATLNDVIVIIRSSTISRTSQYPTTGPFPVDALNTDLGKMVSWLQELQVLTNRGLQLPATDSLTSMTIPAASTRALQLLGFDASGNAIAAQPSNAAVSVAMQPVVAGATLAAARTALGVGYGTGLKSDGAGNVTLDINGLTAKAVSVSSADKLPIYDAAGAVLKSILLNQAGKIGAVSITTFSALASCGAGNMPNTDTVPTSSMGNQVMSGAITPQNAGSTLLILACVNGAGSTSANAVASLLRDSGASALAASGIAANTIPSQILLFTAVPATAAVSTTFKVNASLVTVGTFYFNGSGAAARLYGGVNASFLAIIEILP